MFYSLRGKLIASDVNYIVVECGGVGFKCFTTLNTVQSITKNGEDVTVYTHLCVKEDALDLYGFATQSELDAFKLLITVSGVGPKAAVSVLSELTPDRLALSIAAGDVKSITRAQGVGKKIAERIVLELKDKMGAVASDDAAQTVSNAVSASDNSDCAEAIAALTALGFSQSDAAATVGGMDKSLTVEEMIRVGLKQLSRSL